tara:strand:- start:363 stop:548 length:186 start_codon:yes stop_codon:yes gene_type:complete
MGKTNPSFFKGGALISVNGSTVRVGIGIKWVVATSVLIGGAIIIGCEKEVVEVFSKLGLMR